MYDLTPHQILVAAFGALSDKQKANLRYHLDAGTPILCGAAEAAQYYVYGGRG